MTNDLCTISSMILFSISSWVSLGFLSSVGTCVFSNNSFLQRRTLGLGSACFPEFLQNVSERQILWSLCSVVFHAITLKLPIQTSLSVVPKFQVCVRSGEKCQIFRKTSTPLINIQWQTISQKWNIFRINVDIVSSIPSKLITQIFIL